MVDFGGNLNLRKVVITLNLNNFQKDYIKYRPE